MTDKEKEAIERCNELIKVEHANWIGIRNQVAIETVLNLLEKKDKIIDLMATYIGEIDVSEDLCNDDICDEGNNCNKCIKEYFINKVEKENKDE